MREHLCWSAGGDQLQVAAQSVSKVYSSYSAAV
jgi:hypothetical protein